MIHLVDIDPGNWRLGLTVSGSQKNYVSDSYTMLARAYAYREQRSRAFVIYDDETPVGMGMYHDCPELDAFDLSQLFVKAKATEKQQPSWSWMLCAWMANTERSSCAT